MDFAKKIDTKSPKQDQYTTVLDASCVHTQHSTFLLSLFPDKFGERILAGPSKKSGHIFQRHALFIVAVFCFMCVYPIQIGLNVFLACVMYAEMSQDWREACGICARDPLPGEIYDISV